MQFPTLISSDAEKVFIVCRNVSAAAVSAGKAVEFDVETVTDGNAVTQAKSGSKSGLFAGIADAAMADSAYGLVQVYGYRQSAYCSFASANSIVAGDFLAPVSGYLSDQTMSAATTSGHIWVSVMDTVGAGAGISVVSYRPVFIRAL